MTLIGNLLFFIPNIVQGATFILSKLNTVAYFLEFSKTNHKIFCNNPGNNSPLEKLACVKYLILIGQPIGI